MARPASRVSSRAVAMALLLMLTLLPAPVSSQLGMVVTPLIKQVGKALIKKEARSGSASLIDREIRSTAVNDDDLLGGAAADNAGLVVFNVSVGPEQQTFLGVVDIFNDFLWVRCPPARKSFSKVPCSSPTCLRTLNITAHDCRRGHNCDYVYGSEDDPGTNTTGYLANETFTVGAGIVGRVVFGCSNKSSEPLDDNYGSVGFSNGSLSILSQLNISRFSYYLAPDDSNSSDSTSVVLLGDQAMPQTTGSRSTPLLRSNMFPNWYYVNLTGIKVDDESLTGIPPGAFDLAADRNSGGVVLSTIDPLTFLQVDAYYAVKQKLVSTIKSEPVNGSALEDNLFDLCYNMTSVADMKFPKITMVFDGEDSPVMELTTVHYFYKDNLTGLQCLTMLPMEVDAPVGSVLGSMLQAGTNMIYDVGGGQLTFDKGAAAPISSQVSVMVIASLLVVWALLF